MHHSFRGGKIDEKILCASSEPWNLGISKRYKCVRITRQINQSLTNFKSLLLRYNTLKFQMSRLPLKNGMANQHNYLM